MSKKSKASPGETHDISCVAKSKLPTQFGNFSLFIYLDKADRKEHIALVTGDMKKNKNVLVRIHSECMTGDVFGSHRCDCGEQLHTALDMLARQEVGILLYLRQEGRGIGLINKIKSYALQEAGIDTITANHKLGFPSDMREYSVAVSILQDLKVKSIRLLTNNPDKVNSFANTGIACVERIPLETFPNQHNHFYLKTKREVSGHMLLNV